MPIKEPPLISPHVRAHSSFRDALTHGQIVNIVDLQPGGYPLFDRFAGETTARLKVGDPMYKDSFSCSSEPTHSALQVSVVYVDLATFKIRPLCTLSNPYHVFGLSRTASRQRRETLMLLTYLEL